MSFAGGNEYEDGAYDALRYAVNRLMKLGEDFRDANPEFKEILFEMDRHKTDIADSLYKRCAVRDFLKNT